MLGERVRLEQAASKVKAKSKKYCHECIASQHLYGWRDQQAVSAGWPCTEIGCGGCGAAGCDACDQALARSPTSDGVVAIVKPQREEYPVHLQCFATKSLSVDYAPTGVGKCKCGSAQCLLEKMPKGTPRLVVSLPKHDGTKDADVIYKLDHVRPFLSQLWMNLPGFDFALIEGLAGVADEHRAWALAALQGKVGPPRPPPLQSGARLPKPAKRLFVAQYEKDCKGAKDRGGRGCNGGSSTSAPAKRHKPV